MIRSFLKASRGNVAVTFAVAAFPIILTVGAAVDYSAANRSKAVLDSIADAAVLSVTNQAAMAQTASNAQTSAVTFFNTQAAALKRGTVTNVTATVTDASNSRTAVVSYTATVPTSIAAIAGVQNLNIAGSSSGASAVPTYIDFYLLLDALTRRRWALQRHAADSGRWSTTPRTSARLRATSWISRPTTITASPRAWA